MTRSQIYLSRVEREELSGKAVLVRGDMDVDDGDNPRVESILTVVEFLRQMGAARVKVVGHRETKYEVTQGLRDKYGDVEFDDSLRKHEGEAGNDWEFARGLGEGWDVYVNEAFATSHRKHASLYALPMYMKKEGKKVYLGLRFEKELEMLSGVWGRQGRRVLVIGGVKVEEKERFAREMASRFAIVLRGGLLPGVDMREDGLDISDSAIEQYKHEIGLADVILAAGVMGKYEDSGAVRGTQEVLEAIAQSRAYKVAGGGDIEMAISKFGYSGRFDWISVGGGAMLEYLRSGTLVGIEALEG